MRVSSESLRPFRLLHDVQLRKAAGRGKAQGAARIGRGAAKGCARGVGLRQYLARVRQEIGPLQRQRHLAGGAVQKLDAKLGLKPGKTGAGHGGRKAKLAPRGADVQPLGGHHEQTQGFGVHLSLYPKSEN